MSLFFYTFIFLFMFIGVLLSILILIQESKSLGFGASFGGDNATSMFGASTADVVKKITAILIAIFLSGCLIITYWSHTVTKHNLTQSQFEATED